MSNSKSVIVNNQTAIVADERCKLFGYSSLYDCLDGTVMFINLTDRAVQLENRTTAPIWDTSYDGPNLSFPQDMCELLDVDIALAQEGRPSFTFEELPRYQRGISLIVEPEVAALGTTEGRMDLVALPRPCIKIDPYDKNEQFDLVNISGIPVSYGTDGDYEEALNPEPDIHPYSVMVGFGGYSSSEDVVPFGGNRADYAVLGLPPRKDGTLYLAQWSVAVLAHIGGRTDIVGIEEPWIFRR